MRHFEITIGRSPLPLVRAGVGNIRLAFAVGWYFLLYALTVDYGGSPLLGRAFGLLGAAWMISYYLRLVVACRLSEDALDLVLPVGRVRYALIELHDVILSPHRSYSGVSLIVRLKVARAPRFFNLMTTANERERVLGEMAPLVAEFRRDGLLGQPSSPEPSR